MGGRAVREHRGERGRSFGCVVHLGGWLHGRWQRRLCDKAVGRPNVVVADSAATRAVRRPWRRLQRRLVHLETRLCGCRPCSRPSRPGIRRLLGRRELVGRDTHHRREPVRRVLHITNELRGRWIPGRNRRPPWSPVVGPITRLTPFRTNRAERPLVAFNKTPPARAVRPPTGLSTRPDATASNSMRAIRTADSPQLPKLPSGVRECRFDRVAAGPSPPRRSVAVGGFRRSSQQ
jgi:hypothetical protein